MTQPCIISVAITGSVPRKKDNPAVPITIPEQIESTHEAYEAGASLVHLHVRDEDENSSSDRHRFAELQEGIRKHCPGHHHPVLDGRTRTLVRTARRDAGPGARHGIACDGIGQFPDHRLRESARLRAHACEDDARSRRQARDRDLRPGDALQHRRSGESGTAEVARACAVRDGREERVAGAARDSGIRSRAAEEESARTRRGLQRASAGISSK